MGRALLCAPRCDRTHVRDPLVRPRHRAVASRMNVVTHPTTLIRLRNDRCPRCNAELDTGYECATCGLDAAALLEYDQPEAMKLEIDRYKP